MEQDFSTAQKKREMVFGRVREYYINAQTRGDDVFFRLLTAHIDKHNDSLQLQRWVIEHGDSGVVIIVEMQAAPFNTMRIFNVSDVKSIDQAALDVIETLNMSDLPL